MSWIGEPAVVECMQCYKSSSGSLQLTCGRVLLTHDMPAKPDAQQHQQAQSHASLTAADVLYQAQQLASTLQKGQVLLGTLTVAGGADVVHTGRLHLLVAVDAALGL